MVGAELGLSGPVPLLIQQLSQAVDGPDPAAGLRDRQLLQPVDEIGGFLAGEQTELGCMVLAQSLLFAPLLGNQLLPHQIALLALGAFQFLDQLAEGDGGVHHHRLHGGEAFQGLTDPHCIKDAEVGLVDRITQAGGTAGTLRQATRGSRVLPPPG